MRPIVWVIVAALAAGCMGEDRPSPAPAAAPAEQTDGPEPVANETYRLQIIRTWDKLTLTVLVVPPGYGVPEDPTDPDPIDLLYLRPTLDAITHWKESIDAYGAAALAGNLSFDVYVLGLDQTRPEVLQDPDITILTAPGPAAGIAWGVPVDTTKCLITDFNSPIRGYDTTFLIAAHEFGHCLGMDHPDGHRPWIDLMSYDTDADGPLPALDCVSNLNLLALEQSFAPALGGTAAEAVEMVDIDYVKYDCAERFLGTT